MPMHYRRDYTPGATYFFSVVTFGRRKLFNHPDSWHFPMTRRGSDLMLNVVNRWVAKKRNPTYGARLT
ncbi:protein of unknown function [Legionella fallonii LLAP-10]|uniref:Transposase n=1 Tax=Legionella fallonii LLAP-10 TaxID=1212491 RepID=A0A098FZB8_9GAMM|nr:protein of unknown function [Legionella fallonii LLAP-10]